MIIDKLDELEALLPSLPAALERRRLGEGLSRLAESMVDSHRETARLDALLDIADKTDAVSDDTFAEALADVVDAVITFERLLSSSSTADQLYHTVTHYQEFQKSLKSLDRATRAFWRRCCAPFLQMKGLGELLQKIQGLEQLGQDLIECGETAINISNDITAGEFRDQIGNVLERKSKLEASRNTMVDDPEINVFLIELAANNATLRLVTEKVRIWLERHGALDDFVVNATS